MKHIKSFQLFEALRPIKHLKVYHSTDLKFDQFSLDYAWDGFWFGYDCPNVLNKDHKTIYEFPDNAAPGTAGSHLIEGEMGGDGNNIDFDIQVLAGNFSEVGQYAVIASCNSSERGGFLEYGFMVTPTGTEFIPAQGTTYAVLALILVLVLALLIYSSLRIPWTSGKEINGIFVAVNNFRAYKIATTILSYLVTMWLFGILYNISSSYLVLTGITNFFKWGYTILLSLSIPVIIVGIVLSFIAVISSLKLEKMHERYSGNV